MRQSSRAGSAGVLDRPEGVGGGAADGGVTVLEAVEQGGDGAGILDRPEGGGGGAADVGVTVLEAVEQAGAWGPRSP